MNLFLNGNTSGVNDKHERSLCGFLKFVSQLSHMMGWGWGGHMSPRRSATSLCVVTWGLVRLIATVHGTAEKEVVMETLMAARTHWSVFPPYIYRDAYWTSPRQAVINMSRPEPSKTTVTEKYWSAPNDLVFIESFSCTKGTMWGGAT